MSRKPAQGTPLLCLHTAGADGRQYAALMNDPRIMQNHRVIAFDMPWHGKSSPPAGWHDEEYQLTSAQYTTMILDIMAALGLDKPIADGLLDRRTHRAASGAGASGALQRHHRPAGRRPCRSLLRSEFPAPARRPRRRDVRRHRLRPGRPRCAREASAGRRCGITCRAAPACSRATCISTRSTATSEAASRGIDTRRCPLYLLSGEYDYSCTPEETLAVASSIPGCGSDHHEGNRAFSDERESGGFIEPPDAGAGEDQAPARASMKAVTNAASPAVRSPVPRTRWIAAQFRLDRCRARLASICARSASPDMSTSRIRIMAMAAPETTQSQCVVCPIVGRASGRFPPRPRARRCRRYRPRLAESSRSGVPDGK